MDEGEGLRFQMEVYEANGSHTVVQGLPQGLDLALEGPCQDKNFFFFFFSVFQQKTWEIMTMTSYHLGCAIIMCIFIKYRYLNSFKKKVNVINLPMGLGQNNIS